MDFSPIIQQALGALWYLIPLAILAGILKSPWFKGSTGEFLVNTAARLSLPRDEYQLIKDVTLQTDDGTTQIDHIIVSRYGVFVIETKNMKGWIFGTAHQKTWGQKIYKHTNKFQNPLHQNYKHIKTLEALLQHPIFKLLHEFDQFSFFRLLDQLRTRRCLNVGCYSRQAIRTTSCRTL